MINLKDVIVVYKADKVAVIKRKGERSIAVYDPDNNLKEGIIYDIWFDEFGSYFGLKEIKKLNKIKKISSYKNYKNLYKTASQIDMFDLKNQNEIVTSLEGVYKKGYLYFKRGKLEEKIKLYFKKGIKKPEEEDNILILSGHLGIYKSKIQIVINQDDDFKLLN